MSHALLQFKYLITTLPDSRLYVGTTGSSAIPKRARCPKRWDPYPIPPLRRTRGEGGTSTERQTRRTAHDHGPESDHIHSPSTPGGPNTGTALARRRFRIRPRTNRATIILEGVHPQRNEFLGYIGGVRLSEFIHPELAGTFEGFQIKGADATPIKLPNHAPTPHDGWVDTEIESLVQKGSLASWETVAGTKDQPRPRICLPLGVESNKLRLI